MNVPCRISVTAVLPYLFLLIWPRGLDIPEVKNVIHYHLPVSEEAYVHRNGRTARMNAEGLLI